MASKRARTKPQRWSEDPLSIARLGGSQIKLEAVASSVSPRGLMVGMKAGLKTDITPGAPATASFSWMDGDGRLDGWKGGPLVPVKKENGLAFVKQEKVATVKPVPIKTEPAIKTEPGQAPSKPEKRRRPSKNDTQPVKAELSPAAAERQRIAAKQEARKQATALGASATSTVPRWAQFDGEDERVGEEPYPKFASPTPESCLEAVGLMAADYGLPSADRPYPKERPNLLDALVGTILSQNTTDTNSRRAFKSLKEAMPTWKDVLECDPEVMIEAIRSGGLAEIKTGRVIAILEQLVAEGHVSAIDPSQPSLDHLWELDTASAKAAMVRFNGVGPKTAACVCLFAMRRPEFPVDTHVWKLALKLGWVPPAATRETAYEHLNRRVPPELRFDLHVLLVEHGKHAKNSLGCLCQLSRSGGKAGGGTTKTTKSGHGKPMKKKGGLKPGKAIKKSKNRR